VQSDLSRKSTLHLCALTCTNAEPRVESSSSVISKSGSPLENRTLSENIDAASEAHQPHGERPNAFKLNATVLSSGMGRQRPGPCTHRNSGEGQEFGLNFRCEACLQSFAGPETWHDCGV
jgi:hypothetical protein